MTEQQPVVETAKATDLQRPGESAKEYYERLLDQEVLDKQAADKAAKGPEHSMRLPGESLAAFYKRCWGEAGPKSGPKAGKAKCSQGRQGCTKTRDVCWTYDPYSYELYGEYYWDYFCGNCLQDRGWST